MNFYRNGYSSAFTGLYQEGENAHWKMLVLFRLFRYNDPLLIQQMLFQESIMPLIQNLIRFAKSLYHKIIPSKKRTRKSRIRKVIFGLRLRFVGLLCIVLIVILGFFTLITYINQQIALTKEKDEKASTLTRILSSPAEYYLDKDKNTTREELSLKYKIIEREALNFKNYNDDIVKIILSDEKGNIRYSTQSYDVKHNVQFVYILKSLNQKEEKLYYYDFKENVKDKKGKVTGVEKYRAISYPVFLKRGIILLVLEDFQKYYPGFLEASAKKKLEIYRTLWKKYRSHLPEDFNPQYQAQGKEGLDRKNDLEYLFHELFKRIIESKYRVIPKNERYLWNHNWLVSLKEEKQNAYRNDNASQASNLQKTISDRLTLMSRRIDELRLLGAIAILFDVDKIQRELNQNIRRTLLIALIFLVISIAAFWISVHFLIKNIKKLERWAVKVGHGEIDEPIEIDSNDEIGRLSDVFSVMIEELKAKYHLEKFVSRSTISMIEKKKTSSVDLGMTGRKNFAFIFSDVRGFTSFSEQNDPKLVVEVLNIYFDIQAKIIKAKKGDIDDYVGDQIMAHFGGEQRADTAINVAVEIMKSVEKLNEKRRKDNLPCFEIGIGVHGGDVVVGNIGSGHRMDFTCIGDAVNLTSRLCAHACAGEILVSKELFEQSKKKYPYEEPAPISVKGKSKKIEVIKVTSTH